MLFLEEFEETVEPAGEALDQNGFDLLAYAVDLYNDGRYEHRGSGDTVAVAYHEMIEKVSDKYYKTGFSGANLAKCLEENGSVEDILGGMISVAVYLDEPWVERKWGEEPSFFTSIEYFPAAAYSSKEYDGGHFSVENVMVRYPNTEEDGLERLRKITDILEDEGFNVEMKGCNGVEGDPEDWEEDLF